MSTTTTCSNRLVMLCSNNNNNNNVIRLGLWSSPTTQSFQPVYYLVQPTEPSYFVHERIAIDGQAKPDLDHRRDQAQSILRRNLQRQSGDDMAIVSRQMDSGYCRTASDSQDAQGDYESSSSAIRSFEVDALSTMSPRRKFASESLSPARRMNVDDLRCPGERQPEVGRSHGTTSRSNSDAFSRRTDVSSSVTAVPAAHLRFSIDEILRPDFGRRNVVSNSSDVDVDDDVIVDVDNDDDDVTDGDASYTPENGMDNKHRSNISATVSHSGSSYPSCQTNSAHAQLDRRRSPVVSDSGSDGSYSTCHPTGIAPDCDTLPSRTITDEVSATGVQGGGPFGGNEMNQRGLPAWIYCTRYSDRPCAGRRTSRGQSTKRRRHHSASSTASSGERARTRTAFHGGQLVRLLAEFDACHYLSDDRRRRLAAQLNLQESQIKVWFQNRRAKQKKARRALQNLQAAAAAAAVALGGDGRPDGTSMA